VTLITWVTWEGSATLRSGVYLFNTEEFLSFDNQLPRDSLATLPEATDEVDTTLFEAKQFAQLLCKGRIVVDEKLMEGNPFSVEVVFARKLCYKTDSWEELHKIRQTLLNKRTVTQFLSYCDNQWKRHEKKPLVGKRVYHIVRYFSFLLIVVHSIGYYLNVVIF
jgi:hypothetical protein